MALSTGKVCSVKIGANTVTYLGAWALNKNTNTEDTSHFGTVDETNIATTNNWDATAEGFLDPADTNGQIALIQAQETQTEITLKLYINATQYWSGTAIVTKVSPAPTAKGVTKISYGFKGSGSCDLTLS